MSDARAFSANNQKYNQTRDKVTCGYYDYICLNEASVDKSDSSFLNPLDFLALLDLDLTVDYQG